MNIMRNANMKKSNENADSETKSTEGITRRSILQAVGGLGAVGVLPGVVQGQLGGSSVTAGAAQMESNASALTQTKVAEISNGMKLEVAPDGRVFWTTRGKNFSTRYPDEPTGTARIGIYHPDTNKTTIALEKEVHAGIEDGGQGIVCDPNFEENGWIYFFYSPSNHVIADSQEELESLDTYKESPSESQGEPYNLVSRFTMENGTINPDSEVEIIRIPVQRERCCHVGGALEFDTDGNLLITTGDDTDPFQSSGYAPIDERDGRKFFDAQRSSANTADLRGSLLRITPQDDGSYTVPNGNLFTGSDYADARKNGTVLPEIYAMGFRNPFTITVDYKTGEYYIADYGPDAGSWDSQRGPPGITEYTRVSEPGFYGWPYFTGSNIPYRDYNFATGESSAPFDPENPTNESPNNDGLTELPPAQPATITCPYSWETLLSSVPEYAKDNVPDQIPYPTDGTSAPTGGSPMIGTIYRNQNSYDPAYALPESYHGEHIIMQYGTGWLKTVNYDKNGTVSNIGPFPLSFNSPMNLQIGKKGQLYMLDYPNAIYEIRPTKDDGGDTIDPNTTIELDGKVSGWIGKAPKSINGKTNPTLSLQAGETYKIKWTNQDGAPHDINIEDANKNEIVGTKVMGTQGETQTLEFTATTEMAAYDCSVHPYSMRGSVKVQEDSGSGDDGNDGGGPPAVVGDSPPTDPDGDGLYEDVNGDGKVDHDDVVDLFHHFDEPAVQNNPDAYDFNGNGRLDFNDIVELSHSL
jgi:glucose/arabinose dehydrogenase